MYYDTTSNCKECFYLQFGESTASLSLTLQKLLLVTESRVLIILSKKVQESIKYYYRIVNISNTPLPNNYKKYSLTCLIDDIIHSLLTTSCCCLSKVNRMYAKVISVLGQQSNYRFIL